jgi:hypothetical protein
MLKFYIGQRCVVFPMRSVPHKPSGIVMYLLKSVGYTRWFKYDRD